MLFIDSLLISFSFTLINVEPMILYIFFLRFLSDVKISLFIKALERSFGKVLFINPLTSCPSTPCPSQTAIYKKVLLPAKFFSTKAMSWLKSLSFSPLNPT